MKIVQDRSKYEKFLKNELLARYRINKLYIIRLGELIISSKINNSEDEQLNKNWVNVQVLLVVKFQLKLWSLICTELKQEWNKNA